MGAGKCEICRKTSGRLNDKKRTFLAKFPLDPERCKKWVAATGNEDLIYVPIEKLHQLKFVCGNHFRPNDFNSKMSQLKRKAVPTLNISAKPLMDDMFDEFPLHIAEENIISEDLSHNLDHNYCTNADEGNESQAVIAHRKNVVDRHQKSDLPVTKDFKMTLQNLAKPFSDYNPGNQKITKKVAGIATPGKIYNVVNVNNEIKLVERTDIKLDLNDIKLDANNVNDNKNNDSDCSLHEDYLEDDIFDYDPSENNSEAVDSHVGNGLSDYANKRVNPTQDSSIKETSMKYNSIEPKHLKLKRIIDEFVMNFDDILNSKCNKDQDIIIKGRNGTSIVLLAKTKHETMSTKLLEIESLKKKILYYDTEYPKLKALYNKMKPEWEQLKAIREHLHKSFSQAQIDIMASHRKYRVQWSDDDIKKAIFLKQMISQHAYNYLRCEMKFPLPCLKIMEKWMTDRKIYANLRKNRRMKKKITQPSNESNNITQKINETENGDGQISGPQIDGHQEPDSTEQIQEVVLTVMQNHQVIKDVETEQAVEMIMENREVIVSENPSNSQRISAVQDPNGGLRLVYMDVNDLNNEYFVVNEVSVQDSDNANEDDNVRYVCENSYIQDGNNAHEENNHYADDANNLNNNMVADNNAGENNAHTFSRFSKWELDVIENCGKRKRNYLTRSKFRYTCQLCMKPCKSDEELREHVRVHYFGRCRTTYLDAAKPYICEFCNEKLQQRYGLVRHHIAHLGINEFRCWHPGCTYVGKNKSCLQSHTTGHSPPRHSCPQCSATFTKRKTLREHFARRHSARGRYHCDLCNTVSLSEYTFHQHMTSHDKPPRFKCSVEGCSEAFYSRRSLTTHKWSHSPPPTRSYQCPHCPLATFSLAYQLRRHLERHEKYQIAQCARCKKYFDTYSEYYVHIKTESHTVMKSYVCACSQSFKSKTKLRTHKRECIIESAIDIKEQAGGNENEVPSECIQESIPEQEMRDTDT